MPHEFTLSTLHQLSHWPSVTDFSRELDRAVSDCLERPRDHLPRIVALVLRVTPIEHDAIPSDRVNIDAQVTIDLPPRRGAMVVVRHAGYQRFEVVDATNPASRKEA